MITRGRHLVKQAHERLLREQVQHGVYMSNHGHHDPRHNIQLCSIDTMSSRGLTPPADLIVIDEAHLATSKSFRDFLSWYPDAFILGVTATPFVDEPMDHIAECVVKPVTVQELIDSKFLVPLRYYAPRTPDLSAIKTTKGDFNKEQLSSKMNESLLVGDVVSEWRKYGQRRPTVAFAVDVRHAQTLCAAFQEQNISAAYVDARTPLDIRAEKIEDLRTGRISVLTNCGVLTIGVDMPHVSCLILARPTKSYNLHIQMCLDIETEILTDTGFKKHDEVKPDEIVAVFDSKTEEMSFEKISEKIFRPLYEREFFVTLKSQSIDLRVTNQHDLLYRAGRNHTVGIWNKIPAEDLMIRRSEYSLPTAGKYKFPGVELTDDQLEFIGLWMADGSCSKGRNQFYISQASHQPWVPWMRELFLRIGLEWKERTHSNNSQFKETSPRIHFGFLRGRAPQDRAKNKFRPIEKFLHKIIPDELMNMTADQFERFLYGLHIGDGIKFAKANFIRRSFHICCGKKQFADQLQMMAILRGFQANISSRKNGNGNIHIVNIKKLSQRYVGGTLYTDRPSLKPEKIFPDTHVWCVSTPTGNIVIRRNGKTMIVGNCGRGTRTNPGKSDCLILDHAGNVTRHGFITEERDAIIDGKPSDQKLETAITCFSCYAVFMREQLINDCCPMCGVSVSKEQIEKSRNLKRVDGELVEIVELTEEQKAIREMKLLKKERKRKGYAPGWVFYQMQARFGSEMTAKLMPKRVKPSWIK